MARKKHPRRKPNTGALRYREGRALSWEAAFPLGHSEYRYDSFATWQEATAHLDQLVAERDSVEHPRNIPGGTKRLDRFLTDWLFSKKLHIREKTYENYAYLCDLAVGYFGGERRIDTIERKDADACYAYFHGRAFKNVSHLRMVLAQAFKYAEEENYTKGNPFRRAKAPATDHRPGMVLSKMQRATMLKVATELDPALAPIWHLYGRVGLRRGEGMGLLWSNVDWKQKTITITQQYTDVRNRTVKTIPKTARSRRTFPVPDDVMEMLADLFKEQARDTGRIVTGLIFADDQGEHLAVQHIRWRWKQIKKRAALPANVRIHDLRHTALYHMEQAGIPRSVRMAFAGHTTTRMADKYADHASEDMEAMRAALEKLG